MLKIKLFLPILTSPCILKCSYRYHLQVQTLELDISGWFYSTSYTIHNVFFLTSVKRFENQHSISWGWVRMAAKGNESKIREARTCRHCWEALCLWGGVTSYPYRVTDFFRDPDLSLSSVLHVVAPETFFPKWGSRSSQKVIVSNCYDTTLLQHL